MAYPATAPHRSLCGCVLAMLSAACVLLALPAGATAAPPANDAFLAAELLTGETATATGTNVEATKETGEPNHAGTKGGHSVWYRWIAPLDGLATIDTFGSNFDTVLGVYTGLSVDGLTLVASNDQYNGSQSRVRIGVTAGRMYMIAVDGWSSYKGAVTLHVASAPSPANDALANAQTISGEQASATGSTTNATREPGEPYHASGSGASSIWYAWTAPFTGGVTVDTAGSDFDTVAAVYTGDTVSGLVAVAANNDAPSVKTSRVGFRAIEGTTYKVAIDGRYSDTSGAAVLNLKLQQPPANDLFANAVAIPGDTTAAVAGSNIGASAEPGEPSHYQYDVAVDSVWYTWSAPKSGSLTIRATSSGQMAVAVYTGDRVSELSRVPAQAQASSPGPQQIRVRVTAGTTYRIAVEGLHGRSDDFTLGLTLIDSPPNDDFDDAVLLVGLAADVDGTNVGATQEPGEPVHDQNYYDPSVWYTWTAPASGGVTIDMAGSALNAVVGVYTGDDVAALARVTTSRTTASGRARRRFRAAAGVTYRIAVDGANAAQGTFHLALRWRPAPLNDMFVAAQPLLGETATATGDNIGATGENGEPEPDATQGPSVWYRWTAPSRSVVLVYTPTSDFSDYVSVFTGDDVASLTRIRTNVFQAEPGTTYRIRVDGAWALQRGEFELKLETLPSPPNDDFADAIEMSGEVADATGTTRYATYEPGEPREGLGSVWYRWTAPRSGRTVLSSLGSSVSPGVRAYTGSAVNALTAVPRSGGTSEGYVFSAVEGTTYSFRAENPYYYLDSGGPFRLRLEQADQPPNDMFADALPLRASVDRVEGSTLGGTVEYYEPYYYDYTRSSIWYRWRAPANGRVTIDTAGSDFNTRLAAYVGTSPDSYSLKSIAWNDNDGTSLQSRISFNAVAGTVYRIWVSGAKLDSGHVVLHLRFASPPANDDFSNAASLTGSSTDAAGTNVGATLEPFEPRHAANDGGSSVWYRWTAPEDGSLRVSTVGSDFDSLLGVYEGDSLGQLTLAGANDNAVGTSTSEVTVDVVGGREYRIAVDGANDRQGPRQGAVTLTLDFTAASGSMSGFTANDPPSAPDPPADDPPASDPPADDPPAPDPPADDPPADEPPADDPPAADPLVDDNSVGSAEPGADGFVSVPPPPPNPPPPPPADPPAPPDDPPPPPPADHPQPPADAPAPPSDPPPPPRADHPQTPPDPPPDPPQPPADPPQSPVDPPQPPPDPPIDAPAPPADEPTRPADEPTPPADPPAPPADEPTPPADPSRTDPPVIQTADEDPPAASPPFDPPPPPEQPAASAPAPLTAPSAPSLWYTPARVKLARLLAHGLAGSAGCSSDCLIRATLSLDPKLAARYGVRGASAAATRRYSPAGSPVRFTIQLPAAAKRKLRQARQVRLVVTVTAESGGATQQVVRRLTIRR